MLKDKASFEAEAPNPMALSSRIFAKSSSSRVFVPFVSIFAVIDARPSLPILVSSFDEDFLDAFKGEGSLVEMGLLTQYELSVERILAQAGRFSASTILPASFILSNGLVEAAHEAGIKIITWTVNSTTLLRETLADGVDGVITDSYPELKAFLANGLLNSSDVEAVTDYGSSMS